MLKYEKKTILLAFELHGFIMFLLKNQYSGKEICVLYVSSVKYIQITHIN